MANYTSTHTGATIDASVTIVSSSGVTQSDLTKLNAVTSTAIELNLLDGVTASTAEINILDGLTATTAELNYLDGADSSITTLSLPDNTTITTFGASLIDDADAATARTTLGVDVAGTDNSTDVTLVTTSHDYLSISGQAITLGSIDISDDTNLVGGTGITLTGDTLSTTDSEIVHDNLSGFVANEHIDHSTVSISAGTGLSGGGDLTSTRTLNIDSSVVTLSGTQTLANKSISGTANTISNVHIVDDTINTLTIARGGTGGTTSAEARSNLNVDVAGTDNSTDVTLVTTSHDYLSLSGQAITLGQIDISDDTNLVGGTGITLTGDTLSTTDSEIVHDNLSGFVSNEHIDHSTVSITAGTGLSGGGDITTSRTLTTDDSAIVHDDLSGFVANEHIDHSGVSITAGAGLTGGGDITATRDIAVGAGTGVTVNADDIAIGQDVGTTQDVTFNSVTADIVGDIRGATKFQAKADVALNKGDAVYISGISGNTPTVDIADANDSAKMPSFGLAASSVSTNASVEIITFGTLSGMNTSAFSVGDIIYISTNGTSGNTLTATPPTGETSLIQNIGKVQRSHASAGSIKVGGAGRTNATPNLDDGDIFIGNGSNQAVTASLNTKIEDYLDGGTSTANFDTISVDGAEITATPAELNVLDGITSTTAELNYTDGVTSNIQTQLDAKAPLASPAFTGTATGANLTLSGDLTVNGSTTTLDTTNLAVEDNLMELNAGVTSNANDSGFLIERGSTGDNAIFMWDESADKFTLGTTTATGTTTGDITLSSTGTLVANVEGNVTGAVTGNADTATTLATARNFSLTGDVTAGAVSFDGSGNVALSTTIAANSVALGTDTTGNYMSDLTEGTGIDITHTPAEGSNATITLDLTEVGFGGGANRLITDDGDGTVSTEANLTFDGSTLTINNPTAGVAALDFEDTSDLAIFVPAAQTSNYYQPLIGVGENSTTFTAAISSYDAGGSAAQGLAFHTGDTNAITEAMRIDSSQNVGIGTASPLEKLHIYETGLSAYKTYTSAGAGVLITSYQSQGSPYTKTTDIVANSDGTVPSEMRLFTKASGASSASERLRIDSSGNVGIGTSSPSAKLHIDGSAIFDTDTGSQPFYITRLGSTSQSLKMYVDDNDAVFESIQDETTGTIGNFKFVMDSDSTANTRFLHGTAEKFKIESGGNVVMQAGSRLYLDGGSDTYIQEASADKISIVAGGVTLLDIDEANDMVHIPQDNHTLRIGSGSDLRLWHSGSDTFIRNDTGHFYISNDANDKDLILRSDDGSGGQTAYLTLDGSATKTTLQKDLRADDDVKIQVGSSGDLYLVHDGSNSDIINGTGDLVFRNNADDKDIKFKCDDGSGGVTDYILLDGSTGHLNFSPPGNVGIGTTSPSTNTLQFGSAGDTIGVDLSSGGTTRIAEIEFYNDSDGSMKFKTDNASTGGIEFWTEGSQRMEVQRDGNVGIGTNSPGTKLHIQGSAVSGSSSDANSLLTLTNNANNSIQINSSTTANGQIRFGDADSNFRGAITYGHSDDSLQFSAGGTEAFRIDSQRNLKFADNGTNPSASANIAYLFNDGGEMKVLDELGNTTTISPHNFSLIPDGASEERAWGYYSEKDIVDDEGNVTATQKVNVDMMKLARLVEQLTGEKLVYTEED